MLDLARSSWATERTLWRRLIIAFLCVAVSTAAKASLDEYVGSRVPFVTFFPAVVVAALYGGLPGGLLGTALSGFAASCWLEPIAAPGIHHASDWAAMGVFLISGLLVSAICEVMHSAQGRLLSSERQARRAEEHEREMLQRYEMLAQHSRDIILFIRRSDGRILEANEAALRAYGMDREDLLSLKIHDIRAEQTLAQTKGQMSQADSSGILFETMHRRKDGSTFPVEVSSRGMDQQGERILVSVIRDITERRRAEEALRLSEAKFARAFAANPAAVVLTHLDDGRFLDVNETWVKMLGYSREESLGKSSTALNIWADPEARAQFVEELHRTGSLRGQERRFRNKAGEVFVVLLSAEVLTVAGEKLVLSNVLDITERKRSEESLRKSEAVLSQAGLLAHLGAWESEYMNLESLDSNPLHWSDEVYRIFGYEPGSVDVGHAFFFKHVHPEDRDRVAVTLRQAIESKQPYAIEHRIVRPDGDVRSVVEYAQVIYDEHDRPSRITGAIQDITERKQLEDLLRRQANALHAADHAKDEFLAMLAHELRNPLGAISNAAVLIGMQTKEQKSLQMPVEILNRQVKHTARLVDDLLDVSRITRGQFELRKELVDVADVLSRAVETSRPQMELRRHSLTVDLPEGPIWAEADPARLEQVAGNLLNNAAKYSDPGGDIRLALSVEGSMARIRVQDNGLGIARGMLPRIFDLFTQEERSLDRSHGGLGIGLTLVKRLVEMHGGSVEAFSDGAGCGSTFVVTIPILTSAVEPVAPPTRAQSARLGKVLVVDDNVDAAHALAGLLEIAGHEVFLAHDGPAALEAARRVRPDSVLLDIGLPGMDGYEVARSLRADSTLNQTRLIALTGYGQENDRHRSRSAGFDYHLVKPVDMSVLENLLA